VWAYGGNDASGPVGAVQRGSFGQPATEGLPENPDEGKVIRWDVNNSANLPVARDNAATWSANGGLYLAGGTDGSGLAREVYWAIPSATGDLPEWKHLEASDLPAPGLEGGVAVVSGPSVVIVGGSTEGGIVNTSARANIAPQAPFFQLGLVGATVPGLTIGGELGQQLGYLNAAGVWTATFVLVVLIGIAMAHPVETRAIFRRVLRRERE
jgi:hypothetical protein